MKKVFIILLFVSSGMFLPVFGQSPDRQDEIDFHKEKADSFFDEERYGEAQAEYLEVLAIEPNNPDVFYQLCLCGVGLNKIENAEYWFNRYKKSNPNNKSDISILQNEIKKFKDSGKIKWRNQPLVKHACYFDFKYANAYAPFDVGSHEYFYYQHTMTLGIGINFINNHSWSFVLDAGAYYIPNAEFVSQEDYKWSFRVGTGLRYIHKYPLFTMNKLCFRFTGYGGTGVEYLAEGGSPFGGYDGSSGDGSISDFANSFPYELSLGFLITSRDIPRGIRIEAFYQGHWQSSSSDASVIYKPYFGVTVAFHLGINLKN